MARPREFDETAVLDAAMQCFWQRGYEATSVRDLIAQTGLTSASLYNAFGDKRALYQTALERYVAASIDDRIQRCEALPPYEGVAAFFAEIIRRSVADRDHKGCMMVNAVLDAAGDDAALRRELVAVLRRIEAFFLRRVMAGQADGSIAATVTAEALARHLLAVLLGVRVLARVRPERALLEGAVEAALAMLRGVATVRQGAG